MTQHMQLYRYHGSKVHDDRLRENRDRCPSQWTEKALATQVVDGVVRDESGNPLTTGRIDSRAGVFIFAVAPTTFEMRIHLDGDRSLAGAIKHESLFHNEHVLAAGEIQFENGELVDLNDASGSYATYGSLTLPSFQEAVLKALIAAKVRFSEKVHRLLTSGSR